METRVIEDRFVVASFDIQTVGSHGITTFERYSVTTANTVIVQNVTGGFVREKAFATATEALAYAIDQTGWGMVVEHLTSWDELNA